MKNKFSIMPFFALICTAAVVLAVASVPARLFAREDEALYSTVLERKRQTSRLAPEGEDLYLVRTIHARHSLLAENGAQAGYIETEYDITQLRPALAGVLDSMAKAGVLPAAFNVRLAVLLEQETTKITYFEDSAGFVQVICRFADDATEWESLGMEVEPRTRRVVNFWLTATAGGAMPEGYNAETAIEAYKEWLGLNGLDDWQPQTGSFYNIQQNSQKALMQLFVLHKGRTFAFGAVPLGMAAAE